MQLVVQDDTGKAVASLTDYALDLQYGDGDCDFELHVPNMELKRFWRIHVDGTPYGGIITRRCPSSTEDGDSIVWKGLTVQGVLKKHVVKPPAGQSHLVVSGEANRAIAQVLDAVGLTGFFKVPDVDSGITVPPFACYRYKDAWTNLRMMLSTCGARLKISCQDGGHEISAVKRDEYGTAPSERVYFELEIDDLPVNHLIGLGKGEGTARAVSEWYADIFGNVSQTQTLFGELENAEPYNLNNEEAATLPGKTAAKLRELQLGSEATLTLPLGVELDVGDRVTFSHAKYNIIATAEVVRIVLKAALGIEDITPKFGIPDFPNDEE